MPWEASFRPAVLWPWGRDAGKALTDLSSRELLNKRDWLEEREMYRDLIAAIDQVLTDRGGE